MMSYAPSITRSSISRLHLLTSGTLLTSCLIFTSARAEDDVRQAATDRVNATVAQVEAAYLVGPSTAAKLGCTIAWQANIPVPTGHGIKYVAARPQGVLALNTRNELTLIRSATGDRAWTVAVAQPVDQISSVEIIHSGTAARHGRVSIVADTGIYVHDLENGNGLKKAALRHVPSTGPMFDGNMIVYGSRGGYVVWIDGANGFMFKASAVDSAHLTASSIPTTPVLGEGVIIGASKTGTVAAFGAGSADSMWRRHLLGGVVAAPVIKNGIAFVACEDQYLYAFDLSSGETLWKYFTQSPLTTAPFVADGLVIQYIPTEGTVAFTQNPEGQIGGEVRWKKDGIEGSPITVAGLNGRNVIVYWSAAKRMVTFVDVLRGDIAGTVAMPQVEHLDANVLDEGGFVAWSADGRIERLAPIMSAKPAPAPAVAAPASADSAADTNG